MKVAVFFIKIFGDSIPKTLVLQQGRKRANPDELTQVSSSGA